MFAGRAMLRRGVSVLRSASPLWAAHHVPENGGTALRQNVSQTMFLPAARNNTVKRFPSYRLGICSCRLIHSQSHGDQSPSTQTNTKPTSVRKPKGVKKSVKKAVKKVKEEEMSEVEEEYVGGGDEVAGMLPDQYFRRGNHITIEQMMDLLRPERVQNLVVFDLSRKCNFADHMIIFEGFSARHLRAVGEKIVTELKKRKCVHQPLIEGKESDDWMLVDCGNIMVQMFSRQGREYYDLESLWALKSPENDFVTMELGGEVVELTGSEEY